MGYSYSARHAAIMACYDMRITILLLAITIFFKRFFLTVVQLLPPYPLLAGNAWVRE